MSAEIERCDREIAEIMTRPDVVAGEAPAWLVTLGIEDWEAEKRLLMRIWFSQHCLRLPTLFEGAL